METRCIFLIAVIYVLSISIVNSRRLVKSPKGYRWVNYTTEMWNDPRLVEIGRDSEYSYVVSRTKLDIGHALSGDAAINRGNKRIEYKEFVFGNSVESEVLLIESGGYKWIPSSKNTVEKNRIGCGNIGNKTIYVCRIKTGNNYFTGWTVSTISGCVGPFQNVVFETYDFLVYEM